MSKIFKKAYKYTPLGWLTSGYKKLGWKSPDKVMNSYLDNHSDGEIFGQIALTLLGAGLSGTLLGSKGSSDKDMYDGYDEYDDEDNYIGDTSSSKKSFIDNLINSLGGNTGKSILSGMVGLGGMAYQNNYNRENADLAWERQNDFYNNHLSMPAKVQEYKDAGLNPMALAGSGVGATSAPNVQSADSAVDMSGLLGTLLNYRLQSRQLDIEQERTDITRQDIASQIEYRAEQQLYQQKVNEWFDENQIVSLNKMRAETEDALQRVQTGKADEDLKRAGITRETAEAALITEQWLQKQWENSPEWRRIELQLKEAQRNSQNANAKYTYESIKNLEAQRNNLAADTVLKYAQSEVGKQQLKNLGIEEKQLQFAVDHQKGDLIWNRVGQTVGMVTDVVKAGASVYGASGLFKAGKGALSGAGQRYANEGPLVYPGSSAYESTSGKYNLF